MLAFVPEILEVERYRQAAEVVVGRSITEVSAPDAWFLKRGLGPNELGAALTGRAVTAVRRRGKLLMLDTDGPVLGLRFGMTGRLVVDGGMPIVGLEYGPERTDPAWRRFGLIFEGGGAGRGADVSGPDRLAIAPTDQLQAPARKALPGIVLALAGDERHGTLWVVAGGKKRGRRRHGVSLGRKGAE